MPLSSKSESGSFIEFEVDDDKRFRQLQAVFAALQRARRVSNFRDNFPGDAYWLRFFDDAARAYFWWPTDDEYDAWLRRWYATPLPQRWSDPSLKTGWLFEAMIEGFRDGEFDLLDCRVVDGTRARMEFDVYAWPHAGSGCPKPLVECFGFRVTTEQFV